MRHIIHLATGRTRRLSSKQLHRYCEVGLVDQLTNSTYHVHNWRKYQPLDPTATQRQQRHRAKPDRDSAVTVTDVTTVTRARNPSRPVPSRNGEDGFYSSDVFLPNEARQAGHVNERLETFETSSPYFALLVASCGDSEDAFVKLRRAARGKPEAAVVTAGEAARGPGVVDPLAVALAELGRWTATSTDDGNTSSLGEP
jgi:hypothetical protein